MSVLETPLAERIRSILLEDWDPAGIGFNANLRDDYDEFIPRLISAIEGGAGTDELIRVLRDFEAEMHAPIDDQARERAAEALASIR
jgi:hypothetical protein